MVDHSWMIGIPKSEFDLFGYTIVDHQTGAVIPHAMLGLVCLSAAFFVFLMIPIHIISSLLSTHYNTCKPGRRAPWMSYGISLFHSPTSGLCALLVFLQNYNAGRGLFWGATALQIACLSYTLGYMVVDMLLMLFKPKEFPDLSVLMTHHLVILVSYPIGIFLSSPSFGVMLMCGFQVQEITNPNLTLRWFLLECGFKDSHPGIYSVNGALACLGFFFTRIIFGNYLLGSFLTTFPVGVPTSLVAATSLAVLFQALQHFWFVKMVKMAVKHFFPSVKINANADHAGGARTKHE